MTSDTTAMRRALEMAEHGMRLGEMPIGAVVVSNGEVVAEAHTGERAQRRLMVHAELLALDAADRVLGSNRGGASLFATLEPCVMCLGAAFTARIGRVVYALESPSDGGCAAFRWWNANRVADAMPGYEMPELCSGVLRDESAELFRRFAEESPKGGARDWAAGLARLGQQQ